MQIWSKNPAGIWSTRPTNDMFHLRKKSLRTFIAQRRNMRNNPRQLWIVFYNHEIAELAKIGEFLFSGSAPRPSFKHLIAKMTLEAVTCDLLYTSATYIKIPTQSKPSREVLEPIACKATRYRLYLAVKIEPMTGSAI